MEAVCLLRRPWGVPETGDFALISIELPKLSPDDLHVRTLELSLDPYLRSVLGTGHMDESGLSLGSIVPGRAVAEVVDSRSPDYSPGDLVLAETGWQSEAVVPAQGVSRVAVPPEVPLSAALGLLGMPGLTAFAAHTRHLRPQPGETVVVSSATGGVGLLAGALAKADGARVVAVVGNARKAELAVRDMGYDAAVVRTDTAWTTALNEACPQGIHAYAHMGDQATLNGVMELLSVGARVSLIGLIDQYNGASPTRLRAGAVVAARAIVQGMVVYDHGDLADAHRARVTELLRSGEVTLVEDRYEGLRQAPEAFCRMMAGGNVGKVVVHCSDPGTA